MSVDELEELVAEVYGGAALERVDELRAAIHSVSAPTRDDARGHAVVGGAWFVSFKLSHDPADLERALPLLERAHAVAPTPARGTNLGSALLESAGLPGRGEQATADHARAVELLEAAVAATDEDDTRWVTRATVLLGALLDAVDRRLRGADLDRALDLGERLVRRARELKVGGGEPQNLLGGAHISAAILGHPRADLSAAVALLRESLSLLPDGHPDRASRQSNLGAALLDRYERDGGEEDLRASVVANREALARLSPGDLNRPLVANNLLNALVAHHRLTGSEQDVREALALAPLLEEAFAPADALYPIALSNLGNAEEAAYTIWRDRKHLDRAIELQRRAVATSKSSDPSLAGRRAALAVAIGHRFHETGGRGDLEEALTIGLSAVADAGGPRHEIDRYLSNLANLLHDRYLLTGRIADLDEAARLHLSSLADLPPANPALAGLLNNAGITLSDRFDRLRDPADLRAAIDALSRSVAATPTEHRELAGRLVNLAVAHHRLFLESADDADLRSAVEEAKAAVDCAPDKATRAVALGTLIDGLRTRWAESGDSDDRLLLDQLVEEEANLDAGGRSRRPTRLLRRALMAAADSGGRLEGLRSAAQAGLELRPQVALAAGRQLAADGLSLQVDGSAEGAAIVAEGCAIAELALTHLATETVAPRHLLAWQREASGVAAFAAHSRLLLDDTEGALAAFERGYATLLGGRVTPRPPTETSVCCWSTVHGAGAIISRAAGIDAVELPRLDDDAVRRLVRSLAIAARLGERALTPVVERAGRRLAEVLVEPVIARLEPGEPVVWSAGGLLAMLPITAAPIAGRHLLDRHSLRFAATPGIAGWAQHVAARRSVEAGSAWSIAAPAPSALRPLAYAAAEGAAFAPVAQRLVGAEASVEAAMQAITGGSLVHFACHARTSAVDPLANHLLLADDRPLFADDVIALASPARLAVLAACDTADIGTDHADEALGLASAFQAAGAAGVVASLWPVYDQGTSELMRRFAELVFEETPPVEALRQSAFALRAAGAPPGAWAAFILLGA